VQDIVAVLRSDKPRSREVQLWFSRYLRYVNDYDAAFRSHEAYMRGDDFHAHAHIERGLIFEKLNLPSLAEKEFIEAYQLAPNFATAKAMHAVALERQARRKG
jgi:lipoprotein NlpI